MKQFCMKIDLISQRKIYCFCPPTWRQWHHMKIALYTSCLSETRWKTQRCRKNAYDGTNMCILAKGNVTEIYEYCGLQNVHCSASKVEIISLAFKWLIVLKSATKASDQTHRRLKNALCRFLKWVRNARLRIQREGCWYKTLKVLLHEAIFLATCNATLTTANHCKLQDRCYTLQLITQRCEK